VSKCSFCEVTHRFLWRFWPVIIWQVALCSKSESTCVKVAYKWWYFGIHDWYFGVVIGCIIFQGIKVSINLILATQVKCLQLVTFYQNQWHSWGEHPGCIRKHRCIKKYKSLWNVQHFYIRDGSKIELSKDMKETCVDLIWGEVFSVSHALLPWHLLL
jgi:hypothetical protein